MPKQIKAIQTIAKKRKQTIADIFYKSTRGACRSAPRGFIFRSFLRNFRFIILTFLQNFYIVKLAEFFKQFYVIPVRDYVMLPHNVLRKAFHVLQFHL